MLLWFKALHIFFMLAWMAGIFYLPRLMVYNAASNNPDVKQQLNIMQRRLWLFVTPFAILTLIFGLLLIHSYGVAWLKVSVWLHIKIILVVLLYVYHGYLYHLNKQFAADNNQHSAKFYRILNESPVLLVFAIVALAIIKPFM